MLMRKIHHRITSGEEGFSRVRTKLNASKKRGSGQKTALLRKSEQQQREEIYSVRKGC